MLGFLTKTKQKTKSQEEKNHTTPTQDPLQKDVMKDALTSEVQDKKVESEKKLQPMTLSLEDVLYQDWDLLYPFAKKENSTENLDAWRALERGESNKEIYETWIDAEAKDSLNLPFQVRNVYSKQAKNDQFDQMDMAPLKEAIKANVADSISRLRLTKNFKQRHQAN